MLNHALCSLWTISLHRQPRFRIIGQELRSPIYRDAARPAVEIMKESAFVILPATVQWTVEGTGYIRIYCHHLFTRRQEAETEVLSSLVVIQN